jgi:hypothetical protein
MMEASIRSEEKAMNENSPRRIGRSVFALFAGFVLVVVLSILTDVILRATGVYPPLGQPAPDGLLLAATVYRTIYGVAGSYVTARLATYAPMAHALVEGAIGLVLATIGAVATWSHPEKFGAHWYPVALVILALPTAWVGGKIRAEQLGTPRRRGSRLRERVQAFTKAMRSRKPGLSPCEP